VRLVGLYTYSMMTHGVYNIKVIS
jgi:hypothetical protein